MWGPVGDGRFVSSRRGIDSSVPPLFELQVSLRPGVTVVRLSGGIDALNAPELRQSLFELIDDVGPRCWSI